VDRRPWDEHYFTRQPEAPSRPAEVELALPDLHLTLRTDRGTFSRGRVDSGTKYLLLEAPPPPRDAGTLLDLGCGYGAIAATLARRAPEATVWAVDVNERALALCTENAQRAGVNNVRTSRPDDVPADITFDRIYSNPPIRIGKSALHALLEQWIPRLTADGRAYIVVQRNLGADSLARWFTESGRNVERLGSRAGYRLLEIT
jgi:16S rRNA (guanine1207-N2)-methyltransferase